MTTITKTTGALPTVTITDALPTVTVAKTTPTAYIDSILDLFGSNIIQYLPLSEVAGASVALDLSGNTYNGANTAVTSGSTILTGHSSYLLNGTSSTVNPYSAGLASKYSDAALSVGIFFKGTGSWPTSKYLMEFRSSSTKRLYWYTNATGLIMAHRTVGEIINNTFVASASDRLHFMATFDGTSMRNYLNGSPVGIAQSYTPWGSAVASMSIGSFLGSLWIAGNISDFIILDRAATPEEIATVANPYLTGDYKAILGLGDSKTSTFPGYMFYTCDGRMWGESPYRIGVSGIATQGMADRCVADIAAMTETPDEICINLGANDSPPDVATFQASMDYIIQAYHTAFPSANIRIAKIWQRNNAADILVMNEAIDNLYTANAWLQPGINEADFLEGGDDGVTYTTDGTHPTDAGYQLGGAAWAAVIAA